MLEELNVPYQHVEEARPHSRLVRKYNPTGKVPVLLVFENGGGGDRGGDDDLAAEPPSLVLADSSAINTYLGDKYGWEPNGGTWQMVPPVGTRERTLYDQTILFIVSELDAQGMWMYRKHVDPELAPRYFESIPALAEVSRRQFRRYGAVLAPQCNPYLLGERFSAADILFVGLLDWAQSVGWLEAASGSGDNDSFRNLAAYLRLCRSRPAYRRTVERHRESVRRKRARGSRDGNIVAGDVNGRRGRRSKL